MRLGSRLTAIAAAASLMLLAVSSFAQARPEVEAKERFGRGIDLYGQGDYGGALAEFKRAYDLAPYAVILYNLGLTYAALGRPVEAADAMQRVVDHPGSLSSERLAKARATLREESARIAELTVEANVEGARIEIDGAEVATTPAKPIRIKGGPHRIGVVLSGYAPSRKEIDVAAGAREKIRFELAPTDKRLAHIDVRANVPGATVLVDGAAIGTSPLASTVSVRGETDRLPERGAPRRRRRRLDRRGSTRARRGSERGARSRRRRPRRGQRDLAGDPRRRQTIAPRRGVDPPRARPAPAPRRARRLLRGRARRRRPGARQPRPQDRARAHGGDAGFFRPQEHRAPDLGPR
jgi:hypothetical protein